MCDQELTLEVPEYHITLRVGSKLKLGRFDSTTWILMHGWYTWGGNRPFCGWYMYNQDNISESRPLQLPDLYDIYLIEY